MRMFSVMELLAWDHVTGLPSGGQLRTNGPVDSTVSVLLVGGGNGQDAPGKWSTSMTWLAPRLAAAVGDRARIGQVRYASSSWNELDRGIADVRCAIEHELARDRPPTRIVLVALSMGGATCLMNVDRPEVTTLVAMAPWFPRELPRAGLRDTRLLVVHGSLDNALPLVPGTSLRMSRATVEEAVAMGGDAEWRRIRFGLHGLAVRWRGRIWRMPRAGAFVRPIVAEVARHVSSVEQPRSRSSRPGS